MKLVIDISEEDFKFIKGLRLALGGRGYAKELQRDVINAIKNGTPLSEGHGGENNHEDQKTT